jgi:hypothetical protein
MNQSVVKFEQDGLCVQISRSGEQLCVSLLGVSDSRSPSVFLNPVIEQVVQGAQGTPVTIDFTGLEYMNSATVTPLINLIKALDDAQCSVLVLFSGADWQRTHLQCLHAISRTMSNVRVQGRSPSEH